MRGTCLAIWSFWIGGRGGAQRRLLVVEIGLRRGRQHLHVDIGRIHVLQALLDVEAAARERAVDDAGDVERRVRAVGIGGDGDLCALLGQQPGGFLRQHMRVRVDRTRWPFRPLKATVRLCRASVHDVSTAASPSLAARKTLFPRLAFLR